MGKWSILRNSSYRRTVKSILLIKKFGGLVEMMFGLVNANFSLPEWQTVKLTFFTPCVWNIIFFNHLKFHSFMPYYQLIYQSSEGKGHFSYNENIFFMKVDVVYSLSRTLLKVKNQRRKKQKHRGRLHKSKMQKKRKKKFRKKARTNQMKLGNEKRPGKEQSKKNAKKPRKGRAKGE